MYYIVRYKGVFGFIKPWSAVRDSKTFSQQFLTPSIIEGLRQKLEVTKIVRHKLRYDTISVQQEQTQSRGWAYKKTQKQMIRSQSILERGVMVNPVLILVFDNEMDAKRAINQSVCLCRNEDILLPDGDVEAMAEEVFNQLPGFELRMGESLESFLVGFNRFEEGLPMYGWLEINGKPVVGR